MTSNAVGCQCRSICRLRLDLTIWHKTELDQCLESVTNTKSKTVSLLKQIMNSIHDLRITKDRCDKLRRTIRLITGTESTGEHQDLALSDRFLESVDRFHDLALCHILKYKRLNLCSCLFKRLCCIVLTVCAREYRNKYLWLCQLSLCGIYLLCIIKRIF